MPRLGEVSERQGERHNVGERCGETKRAPTTVVVVGARFLSAIVSKRPFPVKWGMALIVLLGQFKNLYGLLNSCDYFGVFDISNE